MKVFKLRNFLTLTGLEIVTVSHMCTKCNLCDLYLDAFVQVHKIVALRLIFAEKCSLYAQIRRTITQNASLHL